MRGAVPSAEIGAYQHASVLLASLEANRANEAPAVDHGWNWQETQTTIAFECFTAKGTAVSRESECRDVAFEFVTAARYPQSVFEFAADLECVGMRGAKIPAARAHVWKAVIDQLITEGKLVETERGVHAPIEVEKPKQLTLF